VALKILEVCRQKSAVTIPELASIIGITERSVQRNIHKLKNDGLLHRIGGRKEGLWEVLE
jgi:ATP-dependent DNA helicase RecG